MYTLRQNPNGPWTSNGSNWWKNPIQAVLSLIPTLPIPVDRELCERFAQWRFCDGARFEYRYDRRVASHWWSIPTGPNCTDSISCPDEDIAATIPRVLALLEMSALMERSKPQASVSFGELRTQNEALQARLENAEISAKLAQEHSAKLADSHNKLARKFLGAESVLLRLAYAVANRPDALPHMVGLLREWVSDPHGRISTDSKSTRSLADALSRRLETIPAEPWPVPEGFRLANDAKATASDRREPTAKAPNPVKSAVDKVRDLVKEGRIVVNAVAWAEELRSREWKSVWSDDSRVGSANHARAMAMGIVKNDQQWEAFRKLASTLSKQTIKSAAEVETELLEAMRRDSSIMLDNIGTTAEAACKAIGIDCAEWRAKLVDACTCNYVGLGFYGNTPCPVHCADR